MPPRATRWQATPTTVRFAAGDSLWGESDSHGQVKLTAPIKILAHDGQLSASVESGHGGMSPGGCFWEQFGIGAVHPTVAEWWELQEEASRGLEHHQPKA